MFLGHQKGGEVEENIRRNFGMPHPDGYRKAMRIMRLAERLGLPIVTFVDTPGASPDAASEERGQAEAIASSIALMTRLRVPIVTVITGEGGFGRRPRHRGRGCGAGARERHLLRHLARRLREHPVAHARTPPSRPPSRCA